MLDTQQGAEVINGFADAACDSFSDFSNTSQTLGKLAVAGALSFGANRLSMSKGGAGVVLREILPVLSVCSASDLARNTVGSRDAHDIGEFLFDLLITGAAGQVGGRMAFPKHRIDFARLKNPLDESVRVAQAFERRAESPFFAKTDLRTRFPKLTGLERTDVLVVGGGIGGILSANELSAAGIKCMLVDAGPLASLTTGNGCSMMTRVPDVEYSTLKALYGENGYGRYVRALKEAHGAMRRIAQTSTCDFQKYPSYKISYNADDAALRQEFAILKAHDTDVSYLSGDAAASVFGQARTAMVLHNEGSLDPRQLCVGLASSGKFRVFENSPVVGLSIGHPAKGIEVRTDTGRIIAEKVVFATGAPGPMFEHLNKNLTPIQCFASIAKTPHKLHGNYFDDREPDFSYFRQFGPDKVFFGGVARFPSKDVPAVESNPQLSERLQALFPGAKIEKQWTGTIFSTTEDGLPIVAQHPVFPRMYAVTGLGGIGLVNGQAAAMDLRKLLQGKNTETLFSPRRFLPRGH